MKTNCLFVFQLNLLLFKVEIVTFFKLLGICKSLYVSTEYLTNRRNMQLLLLCNLPNDEALLESKRRGTFKQLLCSCSTW